MASASQQCTATRVCMQAETHASPNACCWCVANPRVYASGDACESKCVLLVCGSLLPVGALGQ
eukprot:187172-Alexandrium_andersonii.AAC.1